MNQALLALVRTGALSKSDAIDNSGYPDELVKNLSVLLDRK